MSKNPLGDASSYKENGPQNYNPDLLFAIPRQENRKNLNLNTDLPFSGYDRWNAYEFSWLDNNGLPKVAKLTIDIPCESLFIIESKSLKLYLNSFSFSKFPNYHDVLELISSDLNSLLQINIKLTLSTLEELGQLGFETLNETECLDDHILEREVNFENIDVALLQSEGELITESLVSHLFRSHCPVTNQPDWASIFITYEGKAINKESLLMYLLSYRKHQGFHEDCVERIYCDLNKYCSVDKLSVYGAFTRRGGIDINPFRSNFQKEVSFGRISRQ